jgi:hypothetical protein
MHAIRPSILSHQSLPPTILPLCPSNQPIPQLHILIHSPIPLSVHTSVHNSVQIQIFFISRVLFEVESFKVQSLEVGPLEVQSFDIGSLEGL